MTAIEQEALRLRDNIYGPQSEKNWEHCREFWMRPENLAWLRLHQPKRK